MLSVHLVVLVHAGVNCPPACWLATVSMIANVTSAQGLYRQLVLLSALQTQNLTYTPNLKVTGD